MFNKTKKLLEQRVTDLGPKINSSPRIVQDMPPPGGFPPVRMRRTLMTKFWSPYTITLVGIGIMTYGWYKYIKFTRVKRNLREEQNILEATITPFLQAENDLNFVVQEKAFKKVVGELMKDEPNFDPEQVFKNNNHRYLYPIQSLNLDQFKDCGVLESEK
eukprot:gene3024-5034_t